MEIKKSSKVDLEKKKSVFFEIGLVVALAILFFAFEWKVNSNMEEGFQTVAEVPMDNEVIPITQQMVKPPPPPPPAPKLTDLIDIVEDNTEIEEQLEIEDADADVENKDASNSTDYGEYTEEETGEADIFWGAEDMPTFKGDINKWLRKNLKYPNIAEENNVQGKVIVQFVVEKDGSLADIRVTRSIDSSLDEEALRVVKAMPKWNPGKQRGVPVRVRYSLPISFKLQNR